MVRVWCAGCFMTDRNQIFVTLRQELDGWEELLASLSLQAITAWQPPSTWSIKDVVAHLMAWQQVSNARLEAGRLNREPVFPNWVSGLDPDSEEYLEQFNAAIYEAHRQESWEQVHQEWRDGFLRLLELAEEIPEADLLDADRHPWLAGYSLLAVLEGTLGHHREHYETLLQDSSLG